MAQLKAGTNGVIAGAYTVIFGMLMGALLILVVQRYTTNEKRRVLRDAYQFQKG
ncbi:MAG: hypothetical protein LCI00_17080 [Chloroflexi bacterium]|nr:hypothetical protein [Chloroflexota bacterium]